VLFKLLLLFTVVPLVELWLLLVLADYTSWYVTLGLVIVTGLLGAALSRRQGWLAMRRIRRTLSQGQMPGDAMLDGLLIVVAGTLLITPGVLTDAVGFALLIPPLRSLVKRRLVARFKSRFRFQQFGPNGVSPENSDKIIDVSLVDPPPERPVG